MKKIVTLIVFLLSLSAVAQFSKTHFIPPLSNSDSNAVAPQSQYLYISCPSTTPVNFQIQEIGGGNISGVVSRDTPFVYFIGSGPDTQLLVSKSDVNTVKNNKGFIIQADDLIYATVRLTASQQNNQAGGLVSKGSAALGTQFRIGAFTNTGISAINENHYTFASILATENNTIVSFADIKPGVELINDVASGNTPANVVLNAGESYVIAVQGPTNANRDGLIGALISSDKPIAVNCGSFGGTNGNNDTNLDLGFDQIVSAEKTGNEYIFVKGAGLDVTERPLLVANENGTQVFLNGVASTTLNAGEYLALDGTAFSANGNLYVNTSKNIFAYQGIGGSLSQANQNLTFLPPLSCQTPRAINNIPLINEVGNLTDFLGTVCLVTKTGATLDFIIDGINYTLATLPSNITVNGPLDVTGNSNYVTYTLDNLTGNVSVFSSDQVYLSYYGSSGNATYGGYYSGFTFNPEIYIQPQINQTANCLPYVNLVINAISGFNSFKWYLNGNLITGPGANSSTYVPNQPGYYKVVATLTACNTDFPSDNIPVSACATDMDNDNINDNIDLDIDNDGITNCTESYGDQNISLVNIAGGSINVGAYSNAYTGTVTTSSTASTTPFTGNADGSFVTDIPPGKTNWVQYELSFAQPVSLAMEYSTVANSTDLIDSNGEFIIDSPINKTITVVNPNNQILIDTNYDGVFESGVTQFSSFEIRFRLNSAIPLAAGTGTFRFLTNASTTLTFKHKNLSDTSGDKATMKVYATCVPKDTDNDGIADEYDLDSDNDSIPDAVEAQGQTLLTFSNTDANADGILDMFGTGITPADSDHDGVPNYLDLDSDNDGIHDLDESGFNATDNNSNGVIDGNAFGSNGLANSLETTPDSGILNASLVLADTDADGIYNYIELDSDNDLCNDVIEAGYLDSNLDGLLGGTAPPTVNANGLVTSGVGYGNPNSNYITSAPITITTQPQNITTCELQTATFTVTSNTVTSYQWQLSTDGGTTWNTITNNTTYSGATTATLTIANVLSSMSGYQYRVFLNKNGNTCGLHSSSGILTINALPVITTPITLKQCDDDTDGISTFNLTQKNNVISANYANETFTYYTTLAAATTQNNAFLIANPIAFITANTSVYARVQNSNGCFRVAQIDLLVSVTQIPANFIIPNKYLCDDYLDPINNDRDGISGPFNFNSITASLVAILPNNISIKYYKSAADFLAETDASGNSLAIADPTNYRNTGYPNSQTIWVRAESTIDNSCFGFKTFDVVVESLPFANPINSNNLIRHCDDNHDGIYGFDTSTIQSLVLNGQTNVHTTYTRANGVQSATLPNPLFINDTETITIRVTNNNTQTVGPPCYDEETLQFIVDDLPQANSITNQTIVCDDEYIAIDQNGTYDFDTTTYDATILGTQTSMLLSYTLQNGTILNHLPNPFTTGTQNVTVTITNPINNSCPVTSTIPFIVHPTPKIDQEEAIVICLPSTQTTLDAGILDNTPTTAYTFQWYFNGALLPGRTNPTLTVSATGVYSVTVTNTFGCVKTRTITVTSSEIASIQNISVTDLTEINSILVTVTGSGHYEYALDDSNGPYRESNFFNNVPMGLHELYVRDINGCGIVGPIAVPILGIPRYFTPNGDGFHETWNILGISPLSPNTHSIIYIFDRYGKLLKQIIPNSAGWDGTYNGRDMPSDDYWYSIELVDGRSFKGHFTLKR